MSAFKIMFTFNLPLMLDSVEIKQEPPDDEVVTENGQAKDEDDAKEAGELVSWKFYLQWPADP